MKALDGVGNTLPIGNVNSNTSPFNLVCFPILASVTVFDLILVAGWICLLVMSIHFLPRIPVNRLE
jgi:hypothetical protein